MRGTKMRKRDAVTVFIAMALLAGSIGMIILMCSQFGLFAGVIREDAYFSIWVFCVGVAARHETLRDATVTRLDDLNTRDVTENEWKQFLSTVGGGKR